MNSARILVVMAVLYGQHLFAIEFDFRSLRTTLSRPDTSQVLIYRNEDSAEKLLFNLSPTNNERIGLFADINGIELGYAVDAQKDQVETNTQNFLLSYRKLKNSKITLNYQTLEGLDIEVINLARTSRASQFIHEVKSTKLELFGQHSVYTFGKKTPLFEHFFLNKPRTSNQFDWSVSINSGWSIRRLRLEADNSILFHPEFAPASLAPVNQLDSIAYSIDAGPFISLSAPNNFHFFTELKIGKGVINNLSNRDDLKESGDEKSTAYGLGMSWTSNDEKLLILLRGWKQEGRHVSTSFGDLSMVYFF